MITLQQGNPALWAQVVSAGQYAAARNLPPVWDVGDRLADATGIEWQNTVAGDPGVWFRVVDLEQPPAVSVSGTRRDVIANRDAVATVDGERFVASDVDEIEYLKVAGAWVQIGDGKSGASGGRETARAEPGTFTSPTTGGLMVMTGWVFTVPVPLNPLAQDLEVSMPLVRMGTWSTAVIVAVKIGVYDSTDLATVLAEISSTTLYRNYPKAATDPGAPENLSLGNNSGQFGFPSPLCLRILANAAAKNYQLQMTVTALDSSNVQVNATTVLVTGDSTRKAFMRTITRSS